MKNVQYIGPSDVRSLSVDDLRQLGWDKAKDDLHWARNGYLETTNDVAEVLTTDARFAREFKIYDPETEAAAAAEALEQQAAWEGEGVPPTQPDPLSLDKSEVEELQAADGHVQETTGTGGDGGTPKTRTSSSKSTR